MIISKKESNKDRKLKACLPGSLVKFDSGVLGIIEGASEDSKEILVRFPSGAVSPMSQETIVDQLLNRAEVYVYFLRMLEIVEEV